MDSIFYLIICRLQSRKLMNLISFLVVALCVAVLIMALSLSNGFEKALIDKLIIASPHVTIFGDAEKPVIPGKSEVASELDIAQVQSLSINPDNNQVQGVLLRGTQENDIPELLDGKDVLIEGKFPTAGEAVIGNKFAENTRLTVGNKVKILTGPAISTEFKVSGIFKVGLYDFDSNVIIAPYGDIVDLTPEPGEGMAAEVSKFKALWLRNPMLASEMAKSIEASNPETVVANWQDDNKSLIEAITTEKKVIFIVLLLLVIAASVAIANSQFIQIVSQQEQIAILSAIGFTSRQILITFLLEGFFIGLIGSLSGAIIALIGVFYLDNYPLALPMDVYQVDVVPVVLQIKDICITMLAAIFMVWISSVVPAVYASKMDPVEVLRRS